MAITANPQGSWTEQNIAAITNCLDTAFANVLTAEFHRLTRGLSSSQIDHRLRQSEQSILRLRNSGAMPDYSDPMVVLRYVVRYQLGHINLAYTLIKDAMGSSALTDTGRLQVADFGAGCLAMQFGLTLAVADALAKGERIFAVHINAIDTARPMMDLGAWLWQEFINEARRGGLNFLTEAANLIRTDCHEQHHSVRQFVGMTHWVSALHTLYEGGESAVGSALSGLCCTLEPDRVFVTCHEWKSDLAVRVLPPGQQWGDGRPQLRFAGYIDNSRAARVAFARGFLNWRNPRLYADVTAPLAFTATGNAAARRRIAETERLQREQEQRRRHERTGSATGPQYHTVGAQDEKGNAAGSSAGSSSGGGCLLPVLGAAFFGAAGTLAAIWLGISLLS